MASLACSACRAADATALSLPDQTPVCSGCANQQRAPGGTEQTQVELSRPEKPHLCDICQDAQAYCICVDERAVLCRECDISIHNANKFTAQHSRFLFIGLRVGLESNNKSVVKEQVAAGKRKATAPLSNGNAKQSMNGHYNGGAMGGGGLPRASSSQQMVPNGMQYGMVGNVYNGGNGGASSYVPMQMQNNNGAGPSNMQPPQQYDYNAPAAEFLGVPEISGTFTIKDVDAAYMADEFGQYAPVGVPEDVSNLLEVPDLDFGSIGNYNNNNNQGWGDDGVVPDISYQH